MLGIESWLLLVQPVT